MAEVKIKDGSSFEKAMWNFKRQCIKERIIKEYKQKQSYTKPSQKRRAKSCRKKRS